MTAKPRVFQLISHVDNNLIVVEDEAQDAIEDIVHNVIENGVQDVIDNVITQVIQDVSCTKDSIPQAKCKGYTAKFINVYSQIACHLPHDIDIIIENENLHHIDYMQNNYITYDES